MASDHEAEAVRLLPCLAGTWKYDDLQHCSMDTGKCSNCKARPAIASALRAVEAEARREALTAAHGCHDYNGGHSGTENAAFHHGIDTVINVLTHLAAGEMDTQLAVVLMVGRETLKAKAEEKHGDRT